MRLGWIRRVAAATALTLCLGLAAGDGAALGLSVPVVDSALGAGPTSPAGSSLPSTSNLPVDPAPLLSSVTSTPVQPVGPTGPSGPAGVTTSPSAPAATQASASTAGTGRVQSRGTVRNLVNGDRSSTPPRSVSPTGDSGRRPARRARTRSAAHRGSTSKGPNFGPFSTSQFDHLGRVLGSSPPQSNFFGGFASSRTGSANWAPPLLTLMLLIGLGGFARVAVTARRS